MQRISHIQTSSMFWNPVFHGANVSAHAYIERGWRNFNPAADVRYVGYLRQAWRDVAEQNGAYQKNLQEGARLILGPRKANRELNGLLFDGIKNLQTTPQGKGLLATLDKIYGIKPFSFVKALYRWSGDALWQMGDVRTQAAIHDRQAAHPGEPLKDSIMAVHREIPSYRTPTEEVFPGKAGRVTSGLLQSPALNTALLFTRYHENVMRGLVLIGEDILEGALHPKTPARQGTVEAFGKIAAIAAALSVMNYGIDPAVKYLTGKDDQILKRFGPFSFLQTLLDAVQQKHFSKGATVRTATLNMYAPSPMVEMGANLGGYHAFSMSPIQPGGENPKLRYSGTQVPWGDRLGTMATSILPPGSQARDIAEDPMGGAFRALGATQFGRLTEDDLKKAKAKRRASQKHLPRNEDSPSGG
jgi:hypothetical protein